MASYTIYPQAYFKIFFHAAKHPHKQINGVLLGKESSANANAVDVVDVIPLLHHWTSLSPMMEIGLDLAGLNAQAEGLKLVGYYQACERLDDTALVPVGERIASKIKEGFANAIAFVIDGVKIGSPDDPALIPYLPSLAASWVAHSESPRPFTPGSRFQLTSPDLPAKAIALVRDRKLHEEFGDFDDHLEEVTIDWIHNKDCLPEGVL